MNWLKGSKNYLISVMGPMMLITFYYLFIAADRYVSESVVSVAQSKSTSTDISGLALLAGLSSSSSREDTLYLREYIHSIDMLNVLDTKIDLRKLYAAQTKDPFFRLYDWMPQEVYLWYYHNRVQVVYDDLTGLLKIRTEGFTPKDSQLIARTILNESENFINELSHSMSRQQLAFSEQELRKAMDRYSRAKTALLTFQNRYGMFDPIAQAQAKAALSTEFDASLSRKEAELGAMLSYLQEDAPQVVALQSEINALKAQKNKESSFVASSSGKSMNALAAQYQNLAIEAGFAEDAYKLALTSVEKSRIESNQKLKYLAVIQNPPLPQLAEYPRRIYNLITFFIVMSILFGIAKMIKATIEDHKY